MSCKYKNSQWLVGLSLCLFCLPVGLTLAGREIYAQQRPASASRQATPRQKKSPLENALSKAEIYQAESQLADLGYWTGPIDGLLDGDSKHALIAFQKLQGRKRTGVLTREEVAALLTAKAPPAREPGYAHVEVDLSKQVLFIVEEQGKVSHILPISSGSGKDFTSEGWTRRAVTPTGKFQVCRKIEGWRKSSLGLLYYPNYICGGVAIHGSPSVPPVPSSHGCIRIPMFAAAAFSRLTPIGTLVIVYDERPTAFNP